MCREGADATKAQLVAETQNQVFFKEELNFYISFVLNATNPSSSLDLYLLYVGGGSLA